MPASRRITGARPEALFQPPPERQPLAARMRPRNLDEFVGQAAPGRRARAAASRDRPRPPLVAPAVGSARNRQDQPRAPAGGGDRSRVQQHVRGHVRRRRGSRDDRRGPGAAQPARDPHDPLPRRDPSLQQGPAGRAAAARRGRDRHAHRRDHGEPLLRGQRRAPLPDARLAPRAAGRRGRRDRRPAGPRRCRAWSRRAARTRRRCRPVRCGVRPPGVIGRGRRARRAQRARGRDGPGRGRVDPRRGRAGQPTPRGRRGRGPAACPRLRPGRRRALRHGVGVHQEPAWQRPGRRALLARRDDRGRRGSQVHRPPPDHQRVRGRRQRRSPGAPGGGRGRPGARLDRPAGSPVRAGPGHRVHRGGTQVEPDRQGLRPGRWKT